MWKIVVLAKASVLYIYIDNNKRLEEEDKKESEPKKKKITILCFQNSKTAIFLLILI